MTTSTALTILIVANFAMFGFAGWVFYKLGQEMGFWE